MACGADGSRAGSRCLIDVSLHGFIPLFFRAMTAPPPRFVVIEGSPYGTPVTQRFADEAALREHVIARVRALVKPALRDRLARALEDRVVSEDGVSATSEVIAGTLPFLRALAKAYAPTLAITEKRLDRDDDE